MSAPIVGQEVARRFWSRPQDAAQICSLLAANLSLTRRSLAQPQDHCQDSDLGLNPDFCAFTSSYKLLLMQSAEMKLI